MGLYTHGVERDRAALAAFLATVAVRKAAYTYGVTLPKYGSMRINVDRTYVHGQ